MTSGVAGAGVVRSRLLPALAVGAALWVVLVSALAAALSAPGWWSPWVAWPVAVGLGARRLVGGARHPSGADAGRGLGRARRRGRRVHGVGGGDPLRAGAAPARRREQPPGRGEPGDDARAGGAGRPGCRRWPGGARPRGGGAREPGVLRGGFERGPGGAAAVRRGPGGGLRVRLVGRWRRGGARAAGGGDGAGPAGPGPARGSRGRSVGGSRDGRTDRHPLPGPAHGAGDVLRAARHADADRRAARGDARRRGRAG